MEKELEYLNQIRINMYNSKEYILGKKIYNLINIYANKKNVLKKMFISKKINKNSVVYNDNFDIKINNNIDIKNKKIVVYTCITGNYDDYLEPLIFENNVDYVVFSDSLEIKNKKIEKRDIPDKLKNYSDIDKNRYIKLNPFELFEEKYDYAIYIDGNIQLISSISEFINSLIEKIGISFHRHRNRNDIYKEFNVCKVLKKGNTKNMEEQILDYRKKGFPENYGMVEGNVFVVDLKNNNAKNIFKKWWSEYIKFNAGRDQISLPYVLWDENIRIEEVYNLGSDVYKNKKLYITEHK